MLNGIPWRAIVGVAALVSIGYFCVATYLQSPATVEAAAATPPASLAPMDTATPSAADETLTAAAAELAALAVQSTEQALSLAATESAQINGFVATKEFISVQSTLEVKAIRDYAALTTEYARQTQAAARATEQAYTLAERNLAYQATEAAISQEIETMQYRQQVERELIPYQAALETVTPYAVGAIAVIALWMAAGRVVRYVRRRMDEAERLPVVDELPDEPDPEAEEPVPAPAPSRPLGVALPVSPVKIREFARLVIDENTPLTYSDFCGGGKLFSKPEFINLREALIANKLVMYVNPDNTNSMIVLTREGREYLEKILDAETSEGGE